MASTHQSHIPGCEDASSYTNLYLVTTPVTTLPNSGTAISAVVPLGHDLPRTRVREDLLEAVEKAGLIIPPTVGSTSQAFRY